jgi:hypothetical protein
MLELLLNPVDLLHNLVLIAIVALLCFLVYWKWSAILYFLTGDDKIHWSLNDSVFCCCFQCCGLHHWDWTRHVTLYLCNCNLPPFFSSRYAGRNIARMLGEWAGVVPIQIIIENVVVGDLPGFWQRGRNYIQVDSADNPSQVSEVIDDANPRCMRFNTKFQIGLFRHNPLRKVRFVVKDLQILGHKDICECHVSETDLIDWAGAGLYEPRGPIRIEMSSMSKQSTGALEMPSWIFLECSLPRLGPAQAKIMDKFSLSITRTRTEGALKLEEALNFESAKKFKTKYQLLSATGGAPNVEYEPDEDRADRLMALKRKQRWRLNCVAFVVIAIWGVFFALNTYVGACFIGYKRVEILRLHKQKFPVDKATAEGIFADCHLSDDTLGLVVQANARTIQRIFNLPRTSGSHQGNSSATAGSGSSSRLLSERLGFVHAGDRCDPPVEMITATCYNLPPGRGPVMLPLWFLADFVPCDNKLSCQAHGLRRGKELLLVGVAVLALLPFLTCFFNAQYSIEKKRMLNQLGTGNALPKGPMGCLYSYELVDSAEGDERSLGSSVGDSTVGFTSTKKSASWTPSKGSTWAPTRGVNTKGR